MSQRIYYNKDGSTLWHSDPFAWTWSQRPSSVMDLLNGTLNTNNWSDNSYRLAINFPEEVTVDRCLLRFGANETCTLWVSSDSTNSLDGEWTEVKGTFTATGIQQGAVLGVEYAIDTPTPGTWFQIRSTNGMDGTYLFYVYGEYTNPRYEIVDVNGNSFTTDDPLKLNDAPNNANYTDYRSFKIRNMHTSAHTYRVFVLPSKYGGDSLIDSYFTIAYDAGGGNWTKVDGNVGYVTPSIAAFGGADLSAELRVYCDLPQANNPADAQHWFVVKVAEET